MNFGMFLRKHLPLDLKNRILHSLPYRLYSRFQLSRLPVCVSCEVTTACNLACDMCLRKELLANRDITSRHMQPQLIDRVVQGVENFYKHGRAVYFSPMGMGEPTAYPHLIDLVSRLKAISAEVGVHITTNGILLTAEISRALITAGVDKIVISLNAKDSKTYAARMGSDKYDIVFANAMRLMDLKKSLGKKLPRVFIQYIDYDNTPEVFNEDIQRWRQHMGPYDACFVHPVVNQAGVQKKSKFVGAYGGSYPCTQPLWRIAVKANGNIYPCDPAYYVADSCLSSLYLGNVAEVDLYELFSNRESRANAIVNQMRKGDYKGLPLCEKCNTYQLACNAFFKVPCGKKLTGYKWI